MSSQRSLIVSIILLFVASCGTSESVYPENDTYVYYNIDNSIDEDPEMAGFIRPHVMEMGKIMDQELAVSEGTFVKAAPEGALGNLVSDIVRYRATSEMRERVHISIMNNGSLRVALPEGAITMGHIYELMPFDNYIVVLKFSGEQILQIVDELAGVNGEPVSGIRFRIVDGSARDVLVDYMSVNPDQYYWIATNNWIADGGGTFATMWEPVERHNLDVLVRDAIIDYLRSRQVISPYVDHRIRN
ncbi:MAG: 5'-nucleotidase [Balneolales bacterium]